MRTMPRAITEYRCSCGAKHGKSARRCRKCSARARWYRRKAWRSAKISDHYRTGKK